MSQAEISIIIPTYQREQVLLDTINYLLKMELYTAEIIIVDQTRQHEQMTALSLTELSVQGRIRWLHLPHPSIPHAMNVGLIEARSDIVLFLDDDIIPDRMLIEAHLHAHSEGYDIVAGQVLQPGEEPFCDKGPGGFLFCSNRRQLIQELMAGNFSIKRDLAIASGGFDENFIGVAYRFESEFAWRLVKAGEKIFFEPQASIRHLHISGGGTRKYGNHLTSISPMHGVGDYYYALRRGLSIESIFYMLKRPCREVRTKFHLRYPWWIPVKLLGEMGAFCLAVRLFRSGPKYVSDTPASLT